MGERAAEGWRVARKISKEGGAEGADTYIQDDTPLQTQLPATDVLYLMKAG